MIALVQTLVTPAPPGMPACCSAVCPCRPHWWGHSPSLFQVEFYVWFWNWYHSHYWAGKSKQPYTQLAWHQINLCLNTSNWSLTWNSSTNWISACLALPKSLSHSSHLYSGFSETKNLPYFHHPLRDQNIVPGPMIREPYYWLTDFPTCPWSLYISLFPVAMFYLLPMLVDFPCYWPHTWLCSLTRYFRYCVILIHLCFLPLLTAGSMPK